MPRTTAVPEPTTRPRPRRAPRLLATVMATAAVFTTTALIAPPASAECSAKYLYKVVTGGYWVNYESLFVPPSNGPVTRAITTTKTRSTTTEVSAELGMSVGKFIVELNAKVGGSYKKTATVTKGSTTRVTAPSSSRNQEIRFGTFKQKIQVDLVYFGCAYDPQGRTFFEYAAKEAAGVVFV